MVLLLLVHAIAWVGWLVPYSGKVSSHSNHTPRKALPFSSSCFKDCRKTAAGIHGNNECNTFYCLDALPDKKPSNGTGPLSADVLKWIGSVLDDAITECS